MEPCDLLLYEAIDMTILSFSQWVLESERSLNFAGWSVYDMQELYFEIMDRAFGGRYV